MRMEYYIQLRDNGQSLEAIREEEELSEATVWTLELGYQCYLRKLPLDQAIDIIKEHGKAL